MSNLSLPLLSQINIYPIKSIKGISLSTSWVEKQGIMFDRRYMLADQEGVMITARAYPQLVRVKANLTPNGMWLSFDNTVPFKLSMTEFEMEQVKTNVWNDVFTAFSTTEPANRWFSSVLGRPVQLLYTGEESKRVREKFGHSVSFADGYPLLVISEASLAALNERSTDSHEMAQFRPNIVISGDEAFVEDSWKRIKIGDVEFEIRKPCQRCILTTVDAKTGSYKANKEPLKTLSNFRSCEKGEIYFGQNLVALNEGTIQVGDPIEVLEYKQKEVYLDKGFTKSIENESLRLTCVEIEEVAKDFVTYWLEPTHGVLPNYSPGQYLPIEVEANGESYARFYTLSSSPSRLGRYAISVKRVNGGKVSNYLSDNMQVGEVLTAESPSGSFHLQDTADQPLLLLSAGSGVTPMISMLRFLADHNQLNDTVFFHQCSTIDDIPFRDELDTFHARFPGFKMVISLSQAHEEWEGVKGRLALSHIKHIPDVQLRQAFVCGPKPFMNKAKHLLLKMGLPETNYHQESFGVNVENEPKETKPVTLSLNGQEFQGDNQSSILQQAEKQGLYIANSCRAGLCGACMLELKSGQVDQEDVPALTKDAAANGKILACCSVPTTDVELSS